MYGISETPPHALRDAGPVPRKRGWTALYLLSALLFLASYKNFYDPQTGFTRLIAFGSEFSDRSVTQARNIPHFIEPSSYGYDGQFYAQLSLDPALRDPEVSAALDNPPFRSRRILFSWTAWLLGAGQAPLILQAFAIQNALFWLASGWLLAYWLPPVSFFNFSRWFGCMFSGGMMVSARFSLLDGPSIFFLLLMVRLLEQGRIRPTAGVFALSLLARETNLLFAAVIPRLSPWRWSRIALGGAIVAAACIPYALWLWYVTSRLGFAGSEGSGATAAPLLGLQSKLVSLLLEIQASHRWYPALWTVLSLVGYGAQLLAISQRPTLGDRWWTTLVVFGAFSLILGSAVWAGHPGAFVRVLLPMTFAFNVRLTPGITGWVWWAVGNLGVFYGLECMNVPILSRLL